MKKSIGLALIVVSLLFILSNLNESKKKSVKQPEVEIFEPQYEYGILVDSFNLVNGVVQPGQTLGEILYANHISHAKISEIVLKSKGIFDVRRVNSGKQYVVMNSRDTTATANYLIYEESPTTYIVINMVDDIEIYRGEKEITTKTKKASGRITTSLSASVDELGISPRVSIQLSEIYAWTIDFFKIQKEDEFTVYYEDNYIDSEYIGIGNILAAEFVHKGQYFYAFYYKENDSFGEYFDEEGRTLRKAFLKAPLDFYRISSRYSKNRKHPVTGKWKGHFGTDYAAPRGTPIMTTANGTVQTASFTRNNGNFVKIRHNGTYSTQYLHMSKIKPGIKKGVYVKQGETIGYVGSTGLATGPHVCYRFWKNGKQVDPYLQKLPPGDPIKESNKKEYIAVKDSLMHILNIQ